MANPESIHERLEHDRRIGVEYGVPLRTIPYKRLAVFEDELLDGTVIDGQAAPLVEAEAKEGRFGAFVTSTFKGDTDIIEVWGWAD